MESRNPGHFVHVSVTEEEVDCCSRALDKTCQQTTKTKGPPTPFERVMKYLWPDVCGVKSMRFDASMTNSVFKVWKEDQWPVIIRICGGYSRHAVNGFVENAVFSALSDAGIGPKLLVKFANGRVEEFLCGYKAIQGAEKMKQVMPCIAKALARFHVQATQAILSTRNAENIPTIEKTLRSWCVYVQGSLDLFSSLGWVSEFLTHTLERMDGLFPPWSKKALLHGDLQCGNIMLRGSDDDASIRLIDYDYSGYGDVAWDIGNHFNEYAADYQSDPSRALFRWDLLPSDKEKKAFIHEYMKEMYTFPSSKRLCDCDEDRLLQLSEHYMATSHVYYCAWALVMHADSSPHSLNSQFDYLGYAHERYLRYHTCS